jgi:hypothetical protein
LSGNARKLRGMLDQGAVHRTVSIGDLDADKLAFNVMNDTLGFVYDEEPDPDASDHSGKMLKRWRAELNNQNPDRTNRTNIEFAEHVGGSFRGPSPHGPGAPPNIACGNPRKLG